MIIKIYTDNPGDLNKLINKKINDGDLKTWDIIKNDKGEILYTHTPDQWNEKAMPKPSIKSDHIAFEIRWWNKNEPDYTTKGYITGRFIEILMVHFRKHFTYLEIK
ncbi:hypothetical protein [Flavobacterium hiemivividum]|uniref:Uncharacterized protein n=1 Tax=Flavobacterium hiemivividum TaxID=2541734 RepID=A0A4R5CSZ5_9FLAO|nr:hypothetical protein [Flavobacterium hiemivividum]TDE03742.1 hypothetical protein E0F98_09560 [Flavobacterium hiemivividum]